MQPPCMINYFCGQPEVPEDGPAVVLAPATFTKPNRGEKSQRGGVSKIHGD